LVEGIIFGLIVIMLSQYIVNSFSVSLTAPLISAGILTIFALIGLAGNIGQLVLMSNVDYSLPIKRVQKDIYLIFAHKLQLTKLLLCSAPFYMAYVFLGFELLVGVDLYPYLSTTMISFYTISSVAMLLVTLWFINKVHYKNINKPWVKKVMQLIIGEKILCMAQFVNSMEAN